MLRLRLQILLPPIFLFEVVKVVKVERRQATRGLPVNDLNDLNDLGSGVEPACYPLLLLETGESPALAMSSPGSDNSVI